MPSSFNDTLADSGWGVTSPLTFNEPVLLMRVSRAMVTGLARSKLTPSTCSDNGANNTFAAGEVLRSSAEMLASRRDNSRKSNFQGGGTEAGGAAAAVAGGAGAAVAGGTGAAVAGGTGAAAAAGDCASLSKLNDPSDSSQVTSLTPESASEST